MKIVIVDDHPMFRQGLRDVIAGEADMIIVGEASDGEEALRMIRDLRPDAAVLDLDLPKVNGLEIAEQLTRENTRTALIMLTMYDEVDLFERAMEVGATGYILKDSSVKDIVRGIRAVAYGEYYISPALSHHVVKDRPAFDPTAERRLGLFLLTPMERRILRMIAGYQTTPDIARELSISRKTVSHHRENICAKLNLTGRYALSRFAQMHRNHI